MIATWFLVITLVVGGFTTTKQAKETYKSLDDCLANSDAVAEAILKEYPDAEFDISCQTTPDGTDV